MGYAENHASMCVCYILCGFFKNLKSSEKSSCGLDSLDIHTFSHSHDNISCREVYFPIRPLGPCCEWLLLVRHPSPLDTFARPHMQNEALLICHLFGFLALRCCDSPLLLWGCQEMWQPVKTYTSTNPPSMSHQDLCPFGLKFIFLSITFWVPALIFWAFLVDDRDSDLHHTLSQLVYTVAAIWVLTFFGESLRHCGETCNYLLSTAKTPWGSRWQTRQRESEPL